MATSIEEAIDFDQEDAQTFPKLCHFLANNGVSAENVDVFGDLHEYDCEADAGQTPHCLSQVEQRACG